MFHYLWFYKAEVTHSSECPHYISRLQAKMPADGDRGTQVKHVMQVKPFWEGTALQQQLELLSLDVRLLRTQAAGVTGDFLGFAVGTPTLAHAVNAFSM